MAREPQVNESKKDESVEVIDELICGIIMPIANTDGYPNGHWDDVLAILSEAAQMAGFSPNLVSFDTDIGVIQKRIVQNIYSNPIVICDISSRNANVMFELGMRLAFDKPTIIVKDESTPYSFDISPIEHINYPNDLRYKTINEFKETLSKKIKETHERSTKDPGYTTFLKHYGSFEVVKIQEEEVTETKYILSQLNELKALVVENNKSSLNNGQSTQSKAVSRTYQLKIDEHPALAVADLKSFSRKVEDYGYKFISIARDSDCFHLTLSSDLYNKMPGYPVIKELLSAVL